MIKLRGAYYFGVEGKCNFFVAEGIRMAFGSSAGTVLDGLYQKNLGRPVRLRSRQALWDLLPDLILTAVPQGCVIWHPSHSFSMS